MKRVLIFLLVFTIFLTPIAVTYASVFDTIVPCGIDKDKNNVLSVDEECGWRNIVQLGQNILNFLVVFSAVAATVMFIYAGFLYLTAMGDENKIKDAHKIFWNVGLGFIFVLGAFLIIKLIKDTFGVVQ